jgi:hypothetical protein
MDRKTVPVHRETVFQIRTGSGFMRIRIQHFTSRRTSIRIRIKGTSRIRIHINVKDRIQIRIPQHRCGIKFYINLFQMYYFLPSRGLHLTEEGRVYDQTRMQVGNSVAVPDSKHFGKPDPDPHQSEIGIRIK